MFFFLKKIYIYLNSFTGGGYSIVCFPHGSTIGVFWVRYAILLSYCACIWDDELEANICSWLGNSSVEHLPPQFNLNPNVSWKVVQMHEHCAFARVYKSCCHVPGTVWGTKIRKNPAALDDPRNIACLHISIHDIPSDHIYSTICFPWNALIYTSLSDMYIFIIIIIIIIIINIYILYVFVWNRIYKPPKS